jgi:hypothetical protein
MLKPRAYTGQGRKSQTQSAPAPIGGLNARDALAAMPPNDAVTLDNLFPTPTTVDLRKGFNKIVTGIAASVESLMPYNQPTGTSKLFAAASTKIYDVTTTGVVGAAVVTGRANARWQHVNFGTTGGQYLFCVNGVDPALLYNGTNWISTATTATAQTISSITRVGTLATVTTSSPHGLATNNQVTLSGQTSSIYAGAYIITVTGASTFTYVMASDPGGSASVVGTYVIFPAITGVSSATFIGVNAYKNRLYFIPINSLSVWYMPVNSVGGAASQLDLTPLFKLGGYLMAMATWTIDNASGINEYAVFISSQGEIAMYQGSDPSSATDWSIVGTFRIGRPIGRRCFVKVGADVSIVSADGLFPLSKALLTDRSQVQDAISNKITNLINNDVQAYANNFGWECTLYPIGNKLIINVPQTEGKTQYQYVMNTVSGAWCRFTNWNANCFAVMGDKLYFGSNLGDSANSAYVAQADVGVSDAGAYIFGEVKTAFQYFGAPGVQKQILMVRPIFQTAGNMTAALGMDMDFSDTYPTATPSFSGVTGTPWNTGAWNTFPWGDISSIKKDWQSVSGVGDAGALHMRIINNKSSVQWQSVEYVFNVGGVL